MTIALFAVLGAALGVAHAAALRHNVRLYLAGRLGLALALHLVRLVAAAGVLALAAVGGGYALIAAAAGFFIGHLITARKEIS